MSRSVLVAGIGNVFRGDDGFGVEVARRMAGARMPEGTAVVDVGVSSVHLAFDLLSASYDMLVLVDAVSRGGAPGTLYVLDVDESPRLAPEPVSDAHGLTPGAVLAAVRALGGAPPKTRVVGCEPASVDEGMVLSEPVVRAVEPAIEMIRSLIEREVAR